jgi:hypothetical protein
MAADAMAAELNVNNTTKGIGYVGTIYKMGLNQQPDGSTTEGWNTRNAYVRDKTLNVLDYRDMWKYQDPRAYPRGVPGGLNLTRMIYSDFVGKTGTDLMPNLPSNVAGPLKEFSAWTKDRYQAGAWTHLIGAVQATSPPLLGPAQSGAITGNSGLLPNHAHYYNLSALGPVTAVHAGVSLHDDCSTSTIGLVWARGGGNWQGFTCQNWQLQHFTYDGEVLATAQATGMVYLDDKAKHVASGLVFGFRFADSFQPAGEAIGTGSNMCIDLPPPPWGNDTQAMIDTCAKPPKPTQIWTYDFVLEQLSVTNPADGSKYCLDSAGAWRGPVVINGCDDGAVTYDASGRPVVSSQRWTIDAIGAGIGRITHVKSGLVVSGNYSQPYNGAKLVLYDYTDGNTAQQWHAHDPLIGEIHGIGSGRCLDVPNFSTTPGTQVQIYDCHGNAAQQWTYDPTSKELIYAYAPGMCLEARGGGTASGTAVQINNCTGAPEQRWTLQEISKAPGDGGGTISNDKSGLVMDVIGGNTANNTLVQLYASNGTEAQQWSRTSSQGGALYALTAGKCLESDNGTVIRTCASPLSASQVWTYHPIAQTYTVDSPGGPKCLDASDTTVIIGACTGAASQRWSRDFGYSTVTNIDSGLVLDLTGSGTAEGTMATLGVLRLDAQGNPVPTSSQKWVWSQR